jgi:Lrp/AsnC family transcriptional regulator, regulator for asnA, asnC and gidA
MILLQAIDANILRALLVDGRRSFASIAKANGVSADIIANHFLEMEKAGIIVGATTQINYLKLGYQGVALMTIRSQTQYHDRILEEIKKIPDLLPATSYNSIYNIHIVTTIKSLGELDNIKQVIKNRFPIEASRTYLWMDLRNIPEHLALGPPDNPELENNTPPSFESQKNLSIDELDLKIIEELSRNGRAPFGQIAKTVGSSTDTVNRRYERLVKNNVIKVSIQFNPELLGYKGIVHFLISISSQNEIGSTVDLLSKVQNVSWIAKLSGGDYELLVCMLVREIGEIFIVAEQIRRISNIEKIESYLRKISPRWPTPKQYISTF